MRRLLVACLACLALTGCLFASDEADTEPSSADVAAHGSEEDAAVREGWANDAIPEGPDHAHPDRDHHRNLTTANFDQVGWDPLVTDHYNASTGPAYCSSETTLEGRDLVATTGLASDVAVSIVDVTDPASPQLVGELVLPRSPVFDVDFVDDRPYLALATYAVDPTVDRSNRTAVAASADRQPVQPVWRDACGTTHRGPAVDLPKGAGVVLVDLSDVEEPTVEDHVPQPALGPHNVFADTVDGEPLVLSSVVNLAHGASYFNFYRVSSAPQLGAELVDVGTWSSQIDPDRKPSQPPPHTAVHLDAWIQRHPVTNETIAYLANWNGGIVLVEYQGPHQLEHRATWSNYAGPATPDGSYISLFLSQGQMTGQWHRAQPIEGTWNGSHYTVIHQEVSDRPSGRPTGTVALLDTTDPSDPTPVARWTLPVDPNWTEFKHYSPHYLAVQNRTIFVALGHGGVWALDASPEHWPRLRSAGVFVPANASPKPPQGSAASLYDSQPFLGDVVATGDAVVTSDDHGVYVARYDPSVEVPHPDPWHEEPWSAVPEERR